MLVAPMPILKTLIPENQISETPSIRYQIMLLILEMITSLKLYLDQSKNWLSADNYHKFKSHITNYINRNFPDSLLILKDWDKVDESQADVSKIEFVKTIFNIFEVYKYISPTLLESLNTDDVALTDVLAKLQTFTDVEVSEIQIKCISIFIDLDFSKFRPKTEAFSYAVPLLIKCYYENNSDHAKEVLRRLLKNTGMFDGCLYEISIWINGIMDLKHFDRNVANSIVDIFNLTYENLLVFLDELSQTALHEGKSMSNSDIIQNLEDMEITKSNVIIVRHTYLSPVIMGLKRYMTDTECTKSLRVYSNFVLLNLVHTQTKIEVISSLIDSFDEISNSLKSYILSWQNCKEIQTLKKPKGRLDIFETFSEAFFEENMDSFLENITLSTYSELPLNLVDCGIFYINNLLRNDILSMKIVDNFLNFINHLVDKKVVDDEIIDRVFGNVVLLQEVSFLNWQKENSQGFATKFLINVVKTFTKAGISIGKYLKLYKEKLVEDILKIIKRPHKYNFTEFSNILEIFHLDYDECRKILEALSNLYAKYAEFSEIIFGILTVTLKQLVSFCRHDFSLEPLSKQIIENLTRYHTCLSKNNKNYVSSLSSIFTEYLIVFPHSVEYIDGDLFDSLLVLNEYNKDNVSLITYLLSKDSGYVQNVQSNIDVICTKKGMILPILTVLVKKDLKEDCFRGIYEKLEEILLKALAKPQKAGQYFQTHHEGLVLLITKYMPLEICEKFVTKVHKYEVTEVFHFKLLSTIYCNIMNRSRLNAKIINNIILTLVHLQINVLKKGLEENNLKIKEITANFDEILQKIQTVSSTVDLDVVCNNESLKLYSKFCLKYGVSGNPFLLKSLRHLIQVLIKKFQKEDGQLILEMLLSHSEFFSVVLGEDTDIKLEVWSLFLSLCENWNEFMERNHIPVLLASYRAMVNVSDKVILRLLRM